MMKNKKGIITNFFVIIFWLFIWQLISNKLNEELLLPSPLNVLFQLKKEIFREEFWKRIIYSYINIITGFVLSVIIGIFLSILSYNLKIVKILLNPLMATIKSVPVVGIIILFLVWSTSNKLSITVSIFMTLPIIYTNLLKGFTEIDKNLLEMSKVFKVTLYKKVKYIYISQILPYFEAGGIIGLGISWKSGIAAEVIGLPANSIGEILYESKIYLNTVILFSWIVVIIVLGFISEKIFILLIKLFIKSIERIK